MIYGVESSTERVISAGPLMETRLEFVLKLFSSTSPL